MTHDPIKRFRRFARSVTTEVGALDDSFLGRGRSLGAARVLNAIGHGRTDVAELRQYLNLDSGLLSRLLRQLEGEGLITVTPHPTDARARIAALTETGADEFAAYEDISDSRSRDLFDRHPHPQALLDAMDLIASALGRDRIRTEVQDPRAPQALFCLQEYYAELGRRFETGFDVNLSCDPQATDMMAPRGTFLVALSDDMPIGCVGIKGNGGPVAEVKRLWIAPSARGLGLAKRLMQQAEDAARALNITTLRLDTNSALPEALRLYQTTGWTEIPRFNDDPYPDHFFEKHLE
ncbi:bifunctional helix-turn-helix transcriptional regulator/GNAT family N-acetyltransferase [Donghicola tyrosinivorans]|uniref:MarR family protein n=1 Tax=Donghicola tyrosinivorans TaxID=1652492 RepID=A0A2T0X0C3_9RHOB|nr:bifunctional helix-turn-helix transcriptional regulator/GNAT family N-acetyltransferase [Donghicola tyrosinivorans]PRY92294.1 MarR family protein [Donghicola tyrosinivorans]